jgi:hypothetical protein
MFPYRGAFGSLIYFAVETSSDMSFALGQVLQEPRRKYWEAVKWSLSNLRGTSNRWIHFVPRTEDFKATQTLTSFPPAFYSRF